MPLLSRMLKQKAVYWPPSDVISDTGEKTYGDPEEVRCRWEDITETFLDRDGNTFASRAKVYVDRDLQRQGILWQGGLDELKDPVDPFANEEPDGSRQALEIRKFEVTPNLKASRFLRMAVL